MSGLAWSIVATMITAGVLLADLAVYLRHGRDGTLSAAIRRGNQAWPMLGTALGFTLGALFGHFFW